MRHHPSLPGARGALPLALAALLLACSAPASRPPAAATPAAPAPTTAPAATAQAAQAREHVNLGVLSSVSDSGLWIAIAKGYFEEQGLDVETQPFGTAADMVAPLSAGQLDAGGGAPGVGLNNAVARGLEVRIVADKATTSPGHGYEAILIRKDLVDSGQVRVPADLKGRKYALPSVTGITPEVALNRYMRQAGLGARDTDLITMPFPDMVAAFANRSIDAATVIEPFVTQIADHGDAVIAEREDVTYPNHTVAVILYAAPFSRDRQPAARAFMVAYLKALRDYNDAFTKRDPARYREVVDILTRFTPVKDAALYGKMVMPGLDPNGVVNVASLKEDQDYYLANGLQQERVDIDKLVDESFARYAVEQLGGPYR
ncbi:MAG TPA: ABC transporter substrate-binding protein [Chloroflexota bacterium]|nr:ABC transporter substrate-binding protein [Chloroflexota bacterium]